MLIHYVKLALRNIARQRGFAFIGIAGLAVGIAACTAILLWVTDELSYDRFHVNGQSIYHCYRRVHRNGTSRTTAMMPAPLGPALPERTPAIVNCVRTSPSWRVPLTHGTEVYHGPGLFVDPEFLTMFTFPLEQGDVRQALRSPNSVVLTQSTAAALFGVEDPLGQMLDNGLVVTAIAKDPPRNSSIEFTFLLPIRYGEQLGEIEPENWYSHQFDTYLQLAAGASVQEVGDAIRHVFTDVDPERTEDLLLQPLAEVHLRDIEGTGSSRFTYVTILACVAALILVVACVNFMNLSTARAVTRFKEIGVRKTVGAMRPQLVHQIMVESSIHTMAAAAGALCLLEFGLPRMETLFGKRLDIVPPGGVPWVLLAVALFTAFGAGTYPALLLSSFNPVSTIKGGCSARGFRSAGAIRKALLVFQFAISFGFMFGTVVIHRQLDLFAKKDLGIRRENIICIRTDGLEGDFAMIKHELSEFPGVLAVTAVFNPPAYSGIRIQDFDFEGKQPGQNLRMDASVVDADFLDVFGLTMVEGRNFRREAGDAERSNYIVNEAAVRIMGIESPVGKMLDISDSPGTIIGVVRDFHFASLHTPITPLVLAIDPSFYQYLCVEVAPPDMGGAIDFIRTKWSDLRPGREFRYRLFEDLLGREYEVERRTGAILSWFTGLTIVLACLGLFGLAAHNAQRRTKEMGIRKVIGATVADIVVLLTREFILLVVIGAAIITPVVLYAATKWLQSFAYRVEVGWSPFLVAGGLCIGVALLTVLHQALKIARSEPVGALRYE